ncbi:FHA domain-containing protein [Nonomuraea sp. NPDC050394]|uniref:FHA domain-containing protein n=1 Tax=Nonomuraea sp. NPDC050394 TaxID=3364363 RepID=UPI0037B9EFEE
MDTEYAYSVCVSQEILVFWTGNASQADTQGMSSTHPPFRASDGERDRAISELRDRAVEGRISHDTFVGRVDQALRAQNRYELDELVADLPRRATLRQRLTDMVSAVSDLTTRVQAAWRRPRLPRLALPDDERVRYVVGRGSACDLVLSDLTVSRIHAELRREDDGGWMLVDLGSLNGTRLNGWRLVGPARVRSGDEISFGDCGFLLTSGQPSA